MITVRHNLYDDERVAGCVRLAELVVRQSDNSLFLDAGCREKLLTDACCCVIVRIAPNNFVSAAEVHGSIWASTHRELQTFSTLLHN